MATKIMSDFSSRVYDLCAPPKNTLCLGAPNKDSFLTSTREIHSVNRKRERRRGARCIGV